MNIYAVSRFIFNIDQTELENKDSRENKKNEIRETTYMQGETCST